MSHMILGIPRGPIRFVTTRAFLVYIIVRKNRG
jgi:hypothetical protein